MKKVITMLLMGVITLFSGSIAGNNDPYSFYPSELYKPKKGEVFVKAQKLIEISPQRPLVIKDKHGNTMYTTSRGVVMVSVDTSGNMTFSIKGRKHHIRDSRGKITKKWERKAGSNKVIVKDEFDEKLGVEEYGLGGKIIAEYDESDNLKKSYEYNKYGKKMEWITDELTLTKTKFNELGQALYDLNYEGYKVAKYEYDNRGILKYKTDGYGNKTFYDKKENMTETFDDKGNLIVVYNYKKDKDGYTYLESVKDVLTGDLTIYKDSRQQKIINRAGVVISKYKWQGTKLIYVEAGTGEITWYKNGRPTYTTYNGFQVNEWMYHEGKLAGVWDARKNTFTLYTHGRHQVSLSFEEKPSMEKILEVYKIQDLDI